MNAQVHSQGADTEVSLSKLADASVVEQQLASLEQLSNEKLNAYYARRDELKQKISELTKTGNQSAIDAAKSDLGNVEKEIAKRAENIGLIMSAIGHEMGMLDQLGEKLSQDAPEDIAKREAAHSALARAESAVVEAKAAKTAAESILPTLQAELAKAEGTFDFFGVVDLLGKAEKVAAAKRKLSDAQTTIARAPAKIAELEEVLGKARLAIASVEEEIEVDKDHRLKSLNLDQLYAKLTDAEARVSAIVKENIESLERNQANTQVQLVFNRDLRVSSAEELEVLEAEIASKKAEFGQKKAQLEDMVGQETSPAYQKLENEAAELATLIDTKMSEKRIVEGKISTAQVNVSELEASMRALNSDVLLAKSNYNDFVLTAEKAWVAGDNIALLLKTQAAKVSADSLSKGRDAVTLAALDASIATDVANKKTMADNAGRRLSLLDEIAQRTARGEEAGAAHDADYAEKTEAYKEKYGKLGKGGSSPDGSDKAPAGDGDSKEAPKLF